MSRWSKRWRNCHLSSLPSLSFCFISRWLDCRFPPSQYEDNVCVCRVVCHVATSAKEASGRSVAIAALGLASFRRVRRECDNTQSQPEDSQRTSPSVSSENAEVTALVSACAAALYFVKL